jgi:SCY1-like protein 1
MGNAASSLPYAIGKQVSTVNDGWALHEGTQKSDSTNVSVFVAKKTALAKTPVDRNSEPNMTQLAPARWHFSNCKKLRHPHILQVIATLDTDNPNDAGTATTHSSSAETGDFIIVTEPCIPLQAWLATQPPPEQIAWGLESAVRALHFLHASANMSHGTVAPTSFVVTLAGDVKLWNFSLVGPVAPKLSQHFKDYEALVTPTLYRGQERLEEQWSAIEASGVHCMDSYGTGVLIGHMFGGSIPGPLVKAVQRMMTPNLRMRPRLQPLLKCPLFDTPYQKLQLQLEEFPVQSAEQKVGFWQNLTLNMQAGSIPETVVLYKLLPMMKQSIMTICTSDTMKTQDAFRREGTFAMVCDMAFNAGLVLGGR